MSKAELINDLNNCAISFDIRCLLTDLYNKYELSYDEINEILLEHICKEENRGTKFLKRFMVSGDSKETEDEIYTIVQGKSALDEWLNKLENAEWSLYSVEVAGGAKQPAEILKPVQRYGVSLKNIEKREVTTNSTVSVAANTNSSNNQEKPKHEVKNTIVTKKIEEPATSSKSESESKKVSPKKEEKSKSPEEKKIDKSITKKGIESFFGPKKTESKTTSKATAVLKPPSPKKFQDFFKKQSEKPQTAKSGKADSLANKSIQLFDDKPTEKSQSNKAVQKSKEQKEDIPPAENPESSDDEEQLRAIRLDIGSDHEDMESEATASGAKRRRIIESDEEDDEAPLTKQNKKEVAEDVENKAEADQEEEQLHNASETYLDEDEFVVTIKSKKPVKKEEKKKVKSPVKAKPTKSSSKAASTSSTAKTKQGNITSFFKKI